MLLSAKGLKKAIEQYYFENNLTDNNFEEYICTFPNDCNEIQIEGEIPTNGRLKIDTKGNIIGIIEYDNKYYFEFEDENVHIFDDNLYIGKEYNFDFINDAKQFEIVYPGYYKLEVWGAQGGNQYGGYGGYSIGTIWLDKKTKLYIYVGGQGEDFSGQLGGQGGYNGGGQGGNGGEPIYDGGAGGGGATHISLIEGLLYELEDYKSSILIVAGGGGGVTGWSPNINIGGSGGGISGTNGEGFSDDLMLGGNQENGYSFGIGQDGRNATAYFGCGAEGNGGSGGGWYGGTTTILIGPTTNLSGSGGSGYIGNHLLADKVMYCYQCAQSETLDTLTNSTDNVDKKPKSEYAKIGNGYARITYLGLKK